MPSIETLIPDVYALLQTDGWFTDEVAETFGKETARRQQEHFSAREHVKAPRLSKLEPHCPRAYWYSIHHPELAEPLPAPARFKYAYGHMIEALAITCAKAAGHTVEGEQDAICFDGVWGHRDCVIDGVLTDVKSASTMSFQKFQSRSLAHDDSFGYLAQLDGYLGGSANDPIVKSKTTAKLWAIDKQLGKMVLYDHTYRGDDYLRERITKVKSIVDMASPPECECGTVKDGESGNYKLDVPASYNSFKYCCFPSLRTFLYADGPRYLTKVVRTPKRRDGTPITEVDKHGRIVYN